MSSSRSVSNRDFWPPQLVAAMKVVARSARAAGLSSYAVMCQQMTCLTSLDAEIEVLYRQGRGTFTPTQVPYLVDWRARALKGRSYGVERHPTAAERHAASVKSHRAAPSARQTRRNAHWEDARDKEKPLTAQRRRPQINQARTTPPAATRPASARRSV